MSKNILVAVGPSFSESALALAIQRTRESQARLTILHVIDEAPWWAGSFAESLCDTQALVHQLAHAIREHSCKQVNDAGLEVRFETRTLPRDGDSVARLIADAASHADAELVVLGSRRRGMLALGARYAKNVIQRRASCEVLIAARDVKTSACMTRQGSNVENPESLQCRNLNIEAGGAMRST